MSTKKMVVVNSKVVRTNHPLFYPYAALACSPGLQRADRPIQL